MQDKESLKQVVGREALKYVVANAVLGVGSGSTVNAFIGQIGPIAHTIPCAVAASEASAAALRSVGIKVVDLNEVTSIPVYIDGADEIDPDFNLIKGGGAALTREKILACAADLFVCVVDASKFVPRLGAFPLPVEVVPMALRYVCRQLEALGGRPVLRANTLTDNGNVVIDVTGLEFDQPERLESELNQIAGVVCNGIFSRRRADLSLCAGPDGVVTRKR